MTQKKKYYFCFALAISICMTVLVQVFQLYSLPILGILELFMLVNVCMIAVNIFNRKCLNHVGTLIITGSLFLFLLARNTFLFLFSFSSYNHQFNWWFIISPPKGCPTARPKGRISQALLLARYKAVPLESSFLDSSACSLIYFWTASSVIFPIVST